MQRWCFRIRGILTSSQDIAGRREEPSMDLGLTGKVAIVTGGSRGIGRATALAFAEERCDIAFCGRTAADVERMEQELREKGIRVFAAVGDITDAGFAERFVAETAEALAGIDILVNNVGGSAGGRKPFPEHTDAEWQRTFELNIFQAVRTTRLVVPHMRERGGGSVITVSSISGWLPGGVSQYGCAKAAEIFFARELGLELAPENIRVNTVCPGSIMFPGGGWDRFRQANPERFEEWRERDFPLGRLGRAEEVADVIVFLASARAGWVTGASVPVDGAQRQSTVR
jgi:3-oxoacyl-[acyl-carrier protein] reductase